LSSFASYFEIVSAFLILSIVDGENVQIECLTSKQEEVVKASIDELADIIGQQGEFFEEDFDRLRARIKTN
jgi:hypothetical protein